MDLVPSRQGIFDSPNLDPKGILLPGPQLSILPAAHCCRVLVMERLMGVPLTDYSAIRSVTSRDPEMVLIGALNTWFSSVIGCDTFHADVHAGASQDGGNSTQTIGWLGCLSAFQHGYKLDLFHLPAPIHLIAGNLLVLPDGKVGFIDFGIVGRISPITWKAVEALVTSMAVSGGASWGSHCQPYIVLYRSPQTLVLMFQVVCSHCLLHRTGWYSAVTKLQFGGS